MNAAAAARARRGIKKRGHQLKFERGDTTVQVPAVAKGYRGEDLGPGITAGIRFLIVSRLDLADAGFPVPLQKGDLIYFGPDLDLAATIDGVDAEHREYQGCYDVTVSGV